MMRKRGVVWLVLAVSMSLAGLGSPTADATGLNDYLGTSRPLLVFAPANNDPRLVETLNRVNAARCEFADRDMVLAVILAQGDGSIGGRAISGDESRRLRDLYGVDDTGAFAALLIGKDGGEKLRTNAVPDLRSIFSVIDGMQMRGREMSDNPNRC